MDPYSLLTFLPNGYPRHFPAEKRPGRKAEHPPSYSASTYTISRGVQTRLQIFMARLP
jgi:hypothetical protein